MYAVSCNQLGDWTQAVLGIAQAGTSIFASREQRKVAEMMKLASEESDARKRDLLILEADLAAKKVIQQEAAKLPGFDYRLLAIPAIAILGRVWLSQRK